MKKRWEICWELVRLSGVDGPFAIRTTYDGKQTYYGIRNIPDEDMANLIYAAPGLLEALEDLIGLAGSAMREANNDGAEYDVDGELLDARLAAKKARGES